ncbi:hypothetical protein BX592_115138 [Paraburkholderia rhizosphaerae]|uniref:Uncharacterized protein n=1 Tax=Paraburkholderia rhizosphaerae TaxID=480658 RepID=A0A4R8LN44_9BURK|nr:hypothetical protein BX592_115138 [Paraburkholderia rhizosphaerae]
MPLPRVRPASPTVSAPVEPSAELQAIADALREQPLLLELSLRIAGAESCYLLGDRLRREAVMRKALSVMLDMLRARRRAGILGDALSDDLASVRQDLIDAQTKLRRTPADAPCIGNVVSIGPLIPLILMIQRRARCKTHGDHAERVIELLLCPAGHDAGPTAQRDNDASASGGT